VTKSPTSKTSVARSKPGGDLTLVSGGDQLYQNAKLNSGKDLTLDSGGSITFEAVKDLNQESHEKSSSDLAWQSAKGKGDTDETLRQSVLTANGQTVINAVNGLHIDLKQIDQKSVPDSSLKSPCRQYEVINPIPEVNPGSAAPWFGKPGTGTQYQLPMSIDELVKDGFIKPINS
jgi:hypothetical protein